jgi:tetratricopeptide (TPR) repeat protein
MRRRSICLIWLPLTIGGCGGINKDTAIGGVRSTTDSAIAIANLDHLIAQEASTGTGEELLLLRATLLADYEALDSVAALTESASTAEGLLRRARCRSAVHRFAEALADTDAARLGGAKTSKVDATRASVLVAVGRAKEVIPTLESDVVRRPGFASYSTLAMAYGSVGRVREADGLYEVAIQSLDTTSPFPYAMLYFARGLMWSEQAGDRQLGEAMYARAVHFVPEFAAANIHLAELEVVRNDMMSAIARLERVVAKSQEPEALALLGQLHIQSGQEARGRQEVADARQRYEGLLAKHPQAFADHAAEFYLGAGANAERAWALARDNLSQRPTRRAHLLAIRAAHATHRTTEANKLKTSMRERFLATAA